MFKQPLCTYCGMEGHLAAACTWKTSLIQCDDGIHLIDLRKGFSDFYGRVLRRHPDGLLVSVRKATAAEIVIASLRAAAISSRERTADAAPADVPRVSIDVAVNRFEGPAMHWAPDQSERSLGMVEPKQAESSQGERIIQTAPERIYLIVGTEYPRDVDFSELTEVSWCENDIDDGIEYVRADKAGAALARVAELEQERDAANSRLHEVATACATAEQQRDAALARLAELEQEPVGVMRASSEAGVAPYADIWPRLEPGMQLYAAPVAQAGQAPQAWLDVQAERRRQVEAKGFDANHDDMATRGQIARAAGCYALHAGGIGTDWPDGIRNGSALFWPWDKEWWKPRTARDNLVRAGALVLAEIERLDRAAARQPEGCSKAPAGWACTRNAGHEGPCAAEPTAGGE